MLLIDFIKFLIIFQECIGAQLKPLSREMEVRQGDQKKK